MFKTYMRLLGFVSPISKYAVPYFFYALLYALFNTLTYAMILPIMNTLFDDKNSYVFQPVYDFPMHGLSFSDIDASQMLSYVYTQLFGTNFTMSKMLLLLACGTIVMNLLSNFFRYMSAWTVENMRVRSLQRMRNDLFNKIMGMNAGYFSDQRKGDLMSRITQDVMVVQYCITNTLQVAFRDPLLIIGYVIYMLLVSWQLSLFAILFLPVVALIIGLEQTSQVVFHTDQGAVYSSRAFCQAHKDYNILRSMSRVGTPTDNPIIEALNGWIKEELFLDFDLAHAKDVPALLDSYVDFFNNRRLAAALGYRSPVQYRTELGFC